MVLVTPDDYDELKRTGKVKEGVWTFFLSPVDEHTTRFIVRSRSGRKVTPGRFLVFDPAHFIMERKMMLGIRDRAETRARAAA